MKNCLIILAVLFGCFVVAFYLAFFVSGRGHHSNLIAVWRVYGQPTYEIGVFPNEIVVDEISSSRQPRRYTEKGTWRAHAFYGESHLDAPAEVVVATEQRDEDLEIDMGYLKGGAQKLTAVKVRRGANEYFPYPTYSSHAAVAYPPPRGLIRPGMLQCDVDTLPWRTERIDLNPDALANALAGVDDSSQTIVDGQTDKELYTYRSDRPDCPKLLVTIEAGRVTRVEGGAEDSADLPYQLPARPSQQDDDQPDSAVHQSWLNRVFFWLLGK